ncbi:alkaline phosphatase [bacterium]|nr:alkaline phosphatase [bacterium]
MKWFFLIICMIISFTGNIVAKEPLQKAKYVFLFIGDGMGIPQRAATNNYMGRKLLMDEFPIQGITTTYANDRFITGSAASATALATGFKTNINYVGVDPDFRPVKTIAEEAKELGMKVGIISSVSIDHATPAAFYAHVKTRKMLHEIDMDLAKSGFDFFGGGGLMDPTGKKSKAPMGNALELAKQNGYRIVNNKTEFMSLGKNSGKILAWNAWLQDAGALPYAMDMGPEDITLSEFTEKAIELLDNPKGFFMMVEGGKIDWAAHANDAAATITNNIAFDEAIGKALEFYKKHWNETLIVVTGDHECGGLTLGFAGTVYDTNFSILKNQKVSFQKFSDETVKKIKEQHARSTITFEQVKDVITTNFGLKFQGDPKKDQLVLNDFEKKMIEKAFNQSMEKKVDETVENQLLYGGYEPLTVTLTHVLNQKAGLGWTSYSHTGVPISTSAIGAGEELFSGFYDNTDIALKLKAAMGLMAEKKYKL